VAKDLEKTPVARGSSMGIFRYALNDKSCGWQLCDDLHRRTDGWFDGKTNDYEEASAMIAGMTNLREGRGAARE
jgi:hypothetical protein